MAAPAPPDPALGPDPAEPGQLIVVAEGDYRTGSGVLRLWVEDVGPRFVWHNLDWWQEIVGRAYSLDGEFLGRRRVQVRLCGVRLVRLGFDLDG
jgi:hypothetical protein